MTTPTPEQIEQAFETWQKTPYGDPHSACAAWFGCAAWLSSLQSDVSQEGEGWISVDEQVPHTHDRVLIHNGGIGPATYETRSRGASDWQSFAVWVDDMGSDVYGVTHWRPLPAPPATTNEKGEQGL